MSEYYRKYKVVNKNKYLKKLLKIIGTRGYIAGSYAAYVGDDNPNYKPNDIDIFVTHKSFVDDLLVDLAKDSEFCKVENRSESVLSLKLYLENSKATVQIITPNMQWHSFPLDILNSFDMNICQAAIMSENEILGSKDLYLGIGRILKIHDPVYTIKRMMKYYKRGIMFPNTEITKVFKAWEEKHDKLEYFDMINQCDRDQNFSPIYEWVWEDRVNWLYNEPLEPIEYNNQIPF